MLRKEHVSIIDINQCCKKVQFVVHMQGIIHMDTSDFSVYQHSYVSNIRRLAILNSDYFPSLIL